MKLINMSLIKSFRNAVTGIIDSTKRERNLKIQFLAVIFVIVLGLIVRLSSMEWAICIILFGLVISAEMFNTAIEKTLDFLHGDEYSKEVKFIKDVSAGAVLVLAIVSTVIGLIIFMPKLF